MSTKVRNSFRFDACPNLRSILGTRFQRIYSFEFEVRPPDGLVERGFYALVAARLTNLAQLFCKLKLGYYQTLNRICWVFTFLEFFSMELVHFRLTESLLRTVVSLKGKPQTFSPKKPVCADGR